MHLVTYLHGPASVGSLLASGAVTAGGCRAPFLTDTAVLIEAGPLRELAVVVPLDRMAVGARLVTELDKNVPRLVAEPAFVLARRPPVSRLAPPWARHYPSDQRLALGPRL